MVHSNVKGVWGVWGVWEVWGEIKKLGVVDLRYEIPLVVNFQPKQRVQIIPI
ncbi:MAG: hypothetical protein WBA93_37290 [Microcoleaceae cyanobacterium]